MTIDACSCDALCKGGSVVNSVNLFQAGDKRLWGGHRTMFWAANDALSTWGVQFRNFAAQAALLPSRITSSTTGWNASKTNRSRSRRNPTGVILARAKPLIFAPPLVAQIVTCGRSPTPTTSLLSKTRKRYNLAVTRLSTNPSCCGTPRCPLAP